MTVADINVDVPGQQIIPSIFIYVAVLVAVYLGYRPLLVVLRRQEAHYNLVLRRQLLTNVAPKTAMLFTFLAMGLFAIIGWVLTGGPIGSMVGAFLAALLPGPVLRWLRRRRIDKLDGQLVGGVQTLASAVRAGLNLVQAMQLVARDGPKPLRQEFEHLLREYEYGVSLEAAMGNAGTRIGSGDFRLLFSALQTHRERGGDLGETLDRIGDSIREIQRLESRVKTLTAQGRATARALGLMPVIVLAILYFMISRDDVNKLFVDPVGKLILAAIIVLTLAGFLWIRKIMAIDI